MSCNCRTFYGDFIKLIKTIVSKFKKEESLQVAAPKITFTSMIDGLNVLVRINGVDAKLIQSVLWTKDFLTINELILDEETDRSKIVTVELISYLEDGTVTKKTFGDLEYIDSQGSLSADGLCQIIGHKYFIGFQTLWSK